jgi:hypothetical protein
MPLQHTSLNRASRITIAVAEFGFPVLQPGAQKQRQDRQPDGGHNGHLEFQREGGSLCRQKTRGDDRTYSQLAENWHASDRDTILRPCLYARA